MQYEAGGDGHLDRRVIAPLYACKGWLKFLGVLSILSGVLNVLTIIGIIIAWLPIWMGVLLFQAANRIESAHDSESQGVFIEGCNKLKTYFIIMGVLAVIGLVLAVIVFLAGGVGTFLQR